MHVYREFPCVQRQLEKLGRYNTASCISNKSSSVNSFCVPWCVRAVSPWAFDAYLTSLPLLLDLILDTLLAFLHDAPQDVLALLLAHFGQSAVEQGLSFGKLDLQYCNEQVDLQSMVNSIGWGHIVSCTHSPAEHRLHCAKRQQHVKSQHVNLHTQCHWGIYRHMPDRHKWLCGAHAHMLDLEISCRIYYGSCPRNCFGRFDADMGTDVVIGLTTK